MEAEKTCQTCTNFCQHYVKYPDGRFVTCYSGHCVYPRQKFRHCDTKACPHYVPKEEEPPQ